MSGRSARLKRKFRWLVPPPLRGTWQATKPSNTFMFIYSPTPMIMVSDPAGS